MRKEDLLLRIEVQLLFRCKENFAFIPLERSVNVVRSKRRSQQAGFVPAFGDLGGTGHVVCIDLNAGFDMVCRDVSGLRTSFAVYLECAAITRYASLATLSTTPPVVDYMDNAGLAIRKIIDM
ncbi:unnamed protein product [Clavelina lepadiformis]|uniref:Uncharacterized protein n=1 Tax=Clavelina lepadiformis TaxID=159417 RepID=A0ABP0G8Z5_CLALP